MEAIERIVEPRGRPRRFQLDQQGRCPKCRTPLVSLMGNAGPTFACGCNGLTFTPVPPPFRDHGRGVPGGTTRRGNVQPRVVRPKKEYHFRS